MYFVGRTGAGTADQTTVYLKAPQFPGPNDSGISDIQRSRSNKAGKSPAIGYYAAPGLFAGVTGLDVVSERKYVKLTSDGKRISAIDYAEGGFRIFMQNAYSSGRLRVASLLDYRHATKCSRQGTGTKGNPVRYYSTDVLKGYQSGYYSYDLDPSDFSVLDWTPDQWIQYCQEHGNILGRGSDPYNYDLGPYYYEGKYYMLSGLLNEASGSANPAPVLLGEHFTDTGNVAVDRDSLAFGSTSGDALLTQAKLNALESIPVDRMNWIATILESFTALYSGLATAAKGIASKHISDRAYRVVRDTSKELASSGWLSYRYVYNTNKMDISEVSAVSRRLTKLLLKGRNFHTYGFAEANGVQCRTSLEFSTAQLLDLNNPLSKLSRMWAYDLWDLIPFSFMVDWFVDIGDYLLARADEDMLIQCPPIDAWGSFSYEVDPDPSSEYTKTQRYCRFRLSEYDLQHYPEYFAYEESQTPAKSTTVVKRVADTAALAVGIL